MCFASVLNGCCKFPPSYHSHILGHHIKGRLHLFLAVLSLSSEPLVLTHFFVSRSSLPLIISASAPTACSLLSSITLPHPLSLMCCTSIPSSTPSDANSTAIGKCSSSYDQVPETPRLVLFPSVSCNLYFLPPGSTPSLFILKMGIKNIVQ